MALASLTKASDYTVMALSNRSGHVILTKRRLFVTAGLMIWMLLWFCSGKQVSSIFNSNPCFGLGKGDKSFEDRAHQILKENPLIDGHNDFLMFVRDVYRNHIYGGNFADKFEHGGLEQHVDLPRLRDGQSGGVFWSLWRPCPRNTTDFSDDNYVTSVRQTYEQIDLYYRLSERYPHFFTPAKNSAQAQKAFKHGLLISPLAIEGLHQIGNSMATLRDYFRLGVRYATLTWNCHNKYADSALTQLANGTTVVSTPYWGGLSPVGKLLVEEMNRMGMMVDLAHVSKDVMLDVLGGRANEGWNGSLAPPIFSHSGAFAVCPHPRNVPDDVLRLVKKRRSLVMVNFSPGFVSCKMPRSVHDIPEFYPPNSTIVHLVRHIRHIGELIGYEHVGIGSDYDGIFGTPRGLEDVSKFPDLVAEMLRQGVSDADAAKVVGRNLLRVWGEVDAVAERLQKERLPLEDDIR